MNSRRSLSLLSAAAALGMAAAAIPGSGAVVGTADAVARTQAQLQGAEVTKGGAPAAPGKRGTDAYVPRNWPRLRRTSYRYPRPGWSVAQDRRRAKKARNVARNRRAQRGGK